MAPPIPQAKPPLERNRRMLTATAGSPAPSYPTMAKYVRRQGGKEPPRNEIERSAKP